MSAALQRLQSLAVPVSSPRVSGKWFNVRYCPNPAGGEVFNIGVAYVENAVDAAARQVHARLLENLEGFRTLFGEAFEEELRFSIEVVRSALSQKMLDAPLRNVVFGEPRYAAGDSEKDVLDRLFASTVSFHEAKQSPSAQRGPAQHNGAVRKAVFDALRLKADLRAERIIAGDPVYFASDDRGRYPLDVPLRGDKLLGSVVSGAYRTRQPLENNLLRASLDLETAARIFKQDRLGFFVMRVVGEDAADSSLDDVIDTVGWKLHKHGVHVGIEETPERLADDILSWSGI
jgi:hypothetical protein